jgi:hypothetical protein
MKPRRSRCGAIEFPRLIIAIILIAGLVMTLSWLQGRYDASDHRKAIELVKSYRAIPNGPTIPELVEARHRDAKPYDISWSSEITSGCLGIVRVSAYVPKTNERAATTYAFDVRLTDPSIHPTDPTTIEILKSLTTTRTSSVGTSTQSQ